MKLPEANRSGVQSLGRLDTSAPYQIARAKMQGAQDIARTAQATTQGVREIMHQAEIEEKNSQLFDARVGLENDIADFTAENKGKAFFTSNELPDTMTSGAEVQEPAPDGGTTVIAKEKWLASEVYPDLYKTRVESYIDARGSQIADPELRSKWVAEMKAGQNSKYADLKAKSMVTRQKEILAKQTTAIDQATEEGKYNLAVDRVLNSNLDEQQQNIAIYGIRKEEEVGNYKGLVMTQDPALMIQGAVELEDTESYTGRLSMKERTDMSQYLRSKAGQALQKSVTVDKVAQAQATSEADAYQGVYNKAVFNEQDKANLSKFLKEKGNLLTPKKFNDMQELLRDSEWTMQFNRLNGSKRRELINDQSNTYAKDELIKQDKARTELEKKQPYAAGDDRLGGRTVGFNKDDIPGFLFEQYQRYQDVNQLDGLNPLPWDKAQAQDINSYLVNAGDQDRLDFFAMMAGAMPPDVARKAINQLNGEVANGFYIAGQMVLDSRPLEASQIQRGMKQLADKVISTSVIKDVRSKVNESLGDIYGNYGSQRSAMIDASIAYALGSGADLDDLDSDELVGHLYNIGKRSGIKLQLPKNTTNTEFNRNINRGFTPTFIEDSGGLSPNYLSAYSLKPEDGLKHLAEKVTDGDYEVYSVAPEEYAIRTNTGSVVFNEAGRLFTFKMPTAETTDDLADYYP